MPSSGTLLVFAGASLVLVATPGPAVLYLVGRSAGAGRRAGFAAMFGVETGELAFVVCVALGLSALIARSPLALSALRYLGAIYLLVLGIRAWRRAGQHSSADPSVSGRDAFAQGFVVQILNPKVALFFVAYFPQFIRPNQPIAPQVLLLGAMYVAIAIASDSVYVMVASALASRFNRSSRANHHLGRFAAVTYLVLGVAAAVSGDRTSSAKALTRWKLSALT